MNPVETVGAVVFVVNVFFLGFFLGYERGLRARLTVALKRDHATKEGS